MQSEKKEFNASGDIEGFIRWYFGDPHCLAKLAAGRHNILKERLTQVAWHRCWHMARRGTPLSRSRAKGRDRMAYLHLIRPRGLEPSSKTASS
jgi:hypothetical protein